MSRLRPLLDAPPDGALAIVDEGLALIERNGEHMYEAELLRLHGEP